MKGWIPDEELLRQATDAGVDPTSRRVERWRKEGLLPRAVQCHVPGHRGSVSLSPPESVKQLVALCRFHRHERRLDELRFILWWEGYPVDRRKLRTSMYEAFRRVEREFRAYTEEAKKKAKREEADPDLVPVAAAEHITGDLSEKSRSPLVRFMKRNLRRRRADVFSALMVLSQVVLGTVPVLEDPLEEELGEMPPAKALFDGMGLATATQPGPGGIPPWISDGAAALPATLSEVENIGIADVPKWTHLVKQATDDELDLGREGVRFLTEDMPAYIRGFGVLFGKNVMGLGMFRHLDRISTAERMLMIPLFIAVNRRFETAWIEGLRVEVRKVRPQAEALSAIARSFPQYKKYFTIDVAQKLAALPEKERTRIIKDIGGYLRDHHPEVLKAT